MLILSRKKGEKLRIGDDITLTVCRISGKRVQLGLALPGSIRVRRGEQPPEPPTKGTTK